jgi:phosphoglucosamine mutase
MLMKNTAVVTILTNIGIEKSLKKEEIELIRTPVGDKYISQLLKGKGYSIGGEQSGHIIFNKYGTTGDGILTAIKLLEVLADKKSTCSLLYSGLEMYPQYSKNIKVNDIDLALNNIELKSLIENIEDDLGEKGRLIIRKSGTEPLIRIMVKHEQDEVCIQYVERIIECIEKVKD